MLEAITICLSSLGSLYWTLLVLKLSNRSIVTLSLLKAGFTNDGVGVEVVSGVVRALMT